MVDIEDWLQAALQTATGICTGEATPLEKLHLRDLLMQCDRRLTYRDDLRDCSSWIQTALDSLIATATHICTGAANALDQLHFRDLLLALTHKVKRAREDTRA